MSVATTSNRNLLKTVPGLLISGFFLWYTFRGISFNQILALRAVHPAWILGVLGFTAASYTLRCVRWSQMMPRMQRSIRTHFLVCARVLMTSMAANNILPLRIGDVMRIFTYAGDLGASPSIILSTVILEKLLDIFVLVLMFVTTVGRVATPHLRLIANISLGISAIGLLVLLVAARSLQAPIQRLFTRLPVNPKLAKIEHWITLALDATGRLLGPLLPASVLSLRPLRARLHSPCTHNPHPNPPPLFLKIKKPPQKNPKKKSSPPTTLRPPVPNPPRAGYPRHEVAARRAGG